MPDKKIQDSKPRLVALRLLKKEKLDDMALRVELYALKRSNHAHLQKLVKVIETPKSV